MNKIEELQKLEKEIAKLKKHFPLAKNPVVGEGDQDSAIMLLGEAPGSVENKTGRPFVGRAGKFLDKMLHSIGISRKKVYIASGVVKFYPTKRTPNQKEIDLCLPYTVQQIKIANPKLVVLLGNVAIKSLLNKKLSVSKVHGKIFHKEGRVWFATFHPAAAMRFTKIRLLMQKDFQKLQKVIRTL